MASFEAKRRETTGKEVKKLRREGQLPAVLVERGRASIPLVLDYNEFVKSYRAARDVSLVDFDLGANNFKVIVSEVQRDPITGDFLHINFRRVHAGELITTTVPVTFGGESPAVERGEGMLLTLLDELEVECLPKDLPSEIRVDISGLEDVGSSVLVKELPLDLEKINLLGREPTDLVVKIEEPEMEELEEIEEEPLFDFGEEELEEEEEVLEGAETEEMEEGEEAAATEEEGETEPTPETEQ